MSNHIPGGIDAVDRCGLVEHVRFVVGDDRLSDYKKMCNLAVCAATRRSAFAMDVRATPFTIWGTDVLEGMLTARRS